MLTETYKTEIWWHTCTSDVKVTVVDMLMSTIGWTLTLAHLFRFRWSCIRVFDEFDTSFSIST